MTIRVYCYGCKDWAVLVGSTRMLWRLEECDADNERGEQGVTFDMVPDTSEFTCKCGSEGYEEDVLTSRGLTFKDHQVIQII